MIGRIVLFSVAIAGFGFIGQAQAATVNCGNAMITETDSTMSDCESPNISESPPFVIFNDMTFLLGIRDQDGGSVPTSGSPLSWSTDPYDEQGGTGVKDWGISLATNWVGRVLLELKQGTTAGLFDVTDQCNFATNLCTGTWSSVSNGGALNGLSHSRAWYKTDDGGTGGNVPLPAAAWMLLTGICGLGVMRRRKNKA